MAGLAELASSIGSRFSANLQTSFSSLSAQQWIRLIAIAGAYLLLRPYIIKLGGRMQMKQHEADEKAAEEEAAAVAAGKRAALSPNDLRGTSATQQKVSIPADSDDDDDSEPEAGGGSGADWGKKARRRQRKMLRTMLAAHEQKLAEAQADEEDKDIQEFLVD